MEEREGGRGGKEDDHTNSQTRRTRNMENASARGRLSERRRRGARGTQRRRRHFISIDIERGS